MHRRSGILPGDRGTLQLTNGGFTVPKQQTACEHCRETASYVRTQIHDLEDPKADEHVGSTPMVKGGDVHVYKCSKCGHLTRIAVPV